MSEEWGHVPGMVRWTNRHTTPAEVCLGCSDQAAGRWVPVAFCEEAKLVSVHETVYLGVLQPEDWDEWDETVFRLARQNRWLRTEPW